MNNNYPPQNKNTKQSANIPNATPQAPLGTAPTPPRPVGYDPYTQHMVNSSGSKVGVAILIILLLLIFLSVAGVAAYMVYEKVSNQQLEDKVAEEQINEISSEIDKIDDELEKKNEEIAKKEAEIQEAEMQRKAEELKQKEEELRKKQEELARLQQPKTPTGPTYNVYKSNATWSQAYNNSGGRLVSIDSADEFNKVCNLASSNGMVVFWVSPASSYVKWYPGEPSYTNENGEYEDYLMVFKVNGSWYFNDSVNDVSKYYSGKMGYITEQ